MNTYWLFFSIRLQLLLPTAQKILAFVYSVVRTGSAEGKTCPVKEDVGFIHQSEIGCTQQILAKVSQSDGLRMIRSILKRDLLRVHGGFS